MNVDRNTRSSRIITGFQVTTLINAMSTSEETRFFSPLFKETAVGLRRSQWLGTRAAFPTDSGSTPSTHRMMKTVWSPSPRGPDNLFRPLHCMWRMDSNSGKRTHEGKINKISKEFFSFLKILPTFSAFEWKAIDISSRCTLSSDATVNCFHTLFSRGSVSPEDRDVQRKDWHRTTVACSNCLP